jgi:hypothetical protein
MRKKLPLFVGALFVAFTAVACEGPAGPTGPSGVDGTDGAAGPAGPTGPAGQNALNTCSDCHHADATIVAIEQQFDLSPHGFGNFEIRGPDYSGGSCVTCHTHQGFVAAATGTTADWTNGVASLNCRTCHAVHSDVDGDGDMDIGDYALTKTEAVVLRVGGATVDFLGGGNLCAECHQARDRSPYPSYEADLTTMFAVTSGHYGIHYSSQANIYAAQLPAAIAFGATQTAPYGAHYNDGVSCNQCHMGVGVEGLTPVPMPGGTLGHNFAASTAVCATCHEANFDYGGVQTDVATDVTYLAACLEAEGVVSAHYDSSDEAFQGVGTEVGFTGYVNEVHVVGGSGISHPEPYVAAFLALQALFEDGSWGVHQPRFAPAVAANALAFMEANSAACAAITP